MGGGKRVKNTYHRFVELFVFVQGDEEFGDINALEDQFTTVEIKVEFVRVFVCGEHVLVSLCDYVAFLMV